MKEEKRGERKEGSGGWHAQGTRSNRTRAIQREGERTRVIQRERERIEKEKFFQLSPHF